MENQEEKTQKREEALKDVKLYLANDWELKEETPEFFILKRNEASKTVHIILFFTTCLIGNLVYHFLSIKTKKIMK